MKDEFQRQTEELKAAVASLLAKDKRTLGARQNELEEIRTAQKRKEEAAHRVEAFKGTLEVAVANANFHLEEAGRALKIVQRGNVELGENISFEVVLLDPVDETKECIFFRSSDDGEFQVEAEFGSVIKFRSADPENPMVFISTAIVDLIQAEASKH